MDRGHGDERSSRRGLRAAGTRHESVKRAAGALSSRRRVADGCASRPYPALAREDLHRRAFLCRAQRLRRLPGGAGKAHRPSHLERARRARGCARHLSRAQAREAPRRRVSSRRHFHKPMEEQVSFYDRLIAETERERIAFTSIPLIREAVRSGASRDLYLDFLTQAYHHVKHTFPLLAFAAART